MYEGGGVGDVDCFDMPPSTYMHREISSDGESSPAYTIDDEDEQDVTQLDWE